VYQTGWSALERHRGSARQGLKGPSICNLLSNAVKYSPAGGTITIRRKLVSGYLEVSVQDEGIGMTPEQQAHLFEKFYRADPGSSAIGGIGLGLTICKLIVEEYGGHIWAESEAEVGGKFIFTVPLLEGNTATEEHLP
jgi:two-component system sensor histidine kinase VicK